MMKKFAIGILLLISALCGAALFGCDSAPEILNAPQNLRLKNNVLYWDEVEHASGYAIYFDETEQEIDENRFDFSYLERYDEPFEVEVLAIGDGETFSDSEQVSYSSRIDASKITKGLTYELSNEKTGYTVSGNNKVFQEEIVIPAYYEGLPVIKIEPCAFAKLTDSHQSIGGLDVIVDPTITTNATLKSVRLPATLKTIAGNSFAKCVELTEITIPEGVTVIAANAFENCKKLRTVHFPDSLKIIGMYAFRGCSSLTRVKSPEGCEVKIGAFDESVKFD